MKTEPTQMPEPFSLTRTLAVLKPGSALQLVPFSERGRVQSDWIIGIRAFRDSTSVHGSHWERHPRGDEMLTVLQGCIDVVLDTPLEETRLHVDAGHSLVVPQGCWHRLEVVQPGQLLFVTPATDSEHRQRDSER